MLVIYCIFCSDCVWLWIHGMYVNMYISTLLCKWPLNVTVTAVWYCVIPNSLWDCSCYLYVCQYLAHGSSVASKIAVFCYRPSHEACRNILDWNILFSGEFDEKFEYAAGNAFICIVCIQIGMTPFSPSSIKCQRIQSLNNVNVHVIVGNVKMLSLTMPVVIQCTSCYTIYPCVWS